jgi:hypothetical protein
VVLDRFLGSMGGPAHFGAAVTIALSRRKITALTSVPKGLLAEPGVFYPGESIRKGFDLIEDAR